MRSQKKRRPPAAVVSAIEVVAVRLLHDSRSMIEISTVDQEVGVTGRATDVGQKWRAGVRRRWRGNRSLETTHVDRDNGKSIGIKVKLEVYNTPGL